MQCALVFSGANIIHKKIKEVLGGRKTKFLYIRASWLKLAPNLFFFFFSSPQIMSE